MRTLTSVLVAVLTCLGGWGHVVWAQNPAPPSEPAALNVFLDCRFSCDEDFFRREITVVNYVRDRTDADLQILLTRQSTGGGGTEYTIGFIGLGRFSNVDAHVIYVAPPASTADDQRQGILQAAKRGLVRYVADTPLADRIVVTFAEAGDGTDAIDDPWKLWVFRASFGGSVSGERATQGRSIRVTASANRTTPEWKLSVSGTGSYRDDSYALTESTTFKSVSRDVDIRLFAVKSLTDHWSAGIVANAISSTFLNYDFKGRLASGLEYNLFPYGESTRRILALHYTVGIDELRFQEETIFGKLSDRVADHQLGASLTLLQPWGTASGDVSFAQLLSKPDHYSLTAVGNLDLRLFKGLSFNVFSSVSRTHDQIYLPRADVSTEEILVRQRQLATTYRYLVTFGITYSFGSIFNNVVNARFGGVGGEASAF